MTTPEQIAAARHFLESILDTDGRLHAARPPTGYERSVPDHPRGPKAAVLGARACWRHPDVAHDDRQTLFEWLVWAADAFDARGEPGRADACREFVEILKS